MALIKCPECEKEISDHAESCPNCGYPLHKKILPVPPKEPMSDDEIEEWKEAKSVRNSNIAVAAIIGVIALIFVIIIVVQNVGPTINAKAYEYIVAASTEFKDPSSVRLVSGSFDGDTLNCALSANNSFGARKISYYQIEKIGNSVLCFDRTYPEPGSDDTGSLDINSINKKLSKKLSVD